MPLTLARQLAHIYMWRSCRREELSEQVPLLQSLQALSQVFAGRLTGGGWQISGASWWIAGLGGLVEVADSSEKGEGVEVGRGVAITRCHTHKGPIILHLVRLIRSRCSTNWYSYMTWYAWIGSQQYDSFWSLQGFMLSFSLDITVRKPLANRVTLIQ